jgi:hypothetical protein
MIEGVGLASRRVGSGRDGGGAMIYSLAVRRDKEHGVLRRNRE